MRLCTKNVPLWKIIMPRPVNYIVKLRKWAKTSKGNEGLKNDLLDCINLYVAGELKRESLSRAVNAYAKTVQDENSQDKITINVELPQFDFLDD